MIKNHGEVDLTLLNELSPFLPFTLVSLEASGYFFMALYLLTFLRNTCGEYGRRHILLKRNMIKLKWKSFCEHQYVEQKVLPFFLFVFQVREVRIGHSSIPELLIFITKFGHMWLIILLASLMTFGITMETDFWHICKGLF